MSRGLLFSGHSVYDNFVKYRLIFVNFSAVIFVGRPKMLNTNTVN